MFIGKYNGNEYHVVYHHSELIELLEWQSQLCADAVVYLVLNAIPVDRWDHMNYDAMKSIVSMAFIKMQLGKSLPILAFNEACREFAVNMFSAWDSLKEDEVLLINSNGGYCTGKRDLVCDYKEFTVKPYEHLTVVPDSRLLVIENDPTVDEWTVKNLHAPYSYIVNLGKLSENQTTDLMKQFKKETGGTTLFVYTTGIDRPQMEEYVRSAINAKFKRIIWVPSINDYRSTFKSVQNLCDENGIENDVIPKDVFKSCYLEEALEEERT